MAKDREQMLAMFKRIKHGPEGVEIMEFLNDLSIENYRMWKKNDASMNDIHKGHAQAIDFLIDLFQQCDKEQIRTNIEGDFT